MFASSPGYGQLVLYALEASAGRLSHRPLSSRPACAETHHEALLALMPSDVEVGVAASAQVVDPNWLEEIAQSKQYGVRRWGGLVVAGLQEFRFSEDFQDFPVIETNTLTLVMSPTTLLIIVHDSGSKVASGLLSDPPIGPLAPESGPATSALGLVLDSIVDGHMEVLQRLDDVIDTVEELLWREDGRQGDRRSVWTTRKEVSFHNAGLSRAKETIERLASLETPILSHAGLMDEIIEHLERAQVQSKQPCVAQVRQDCSSSCRRAMGAR